MVEQIKEVRSHISPPPSEAAIARRLSSNGQETAALKTMSPNGVRSPSVSKYAAPEILNAAVDEEWSPSCT
jgi:hypothetical protein